MGEPRQPLWPALGAVLLAVGACDLGASGLASLDGGTDATGGTDAAPDTPTGGGADATDSPAPPPLDAGVDAFDAAPPPVDAGSDACPVVTGNTPDIIVATHALTPITVDGQLTDWSCPNLRSLTVANAGATNTQDGGSVPPGAGISAIFALAWDTGHLYVAAEVTDPNLAGTDPEPFNNDAVEMFFSHDSPPTGDYTSNDHQFVVDYRNTAAEYSSGSQQGVVGLASAVATSTGGYTLEASLDVGTLGADAGAAGQSYGFDLQLDDNASGTPQANVVIWHAVAPSNCSCQSCCCSQTNPEPACNTLDFGAVTLAP